LSYVRRLLSGTQLFEIHPLFEEELKKQSLDTRDFIAYIGRLGSIQQVKEIPEELRRVFVTAFDVQPEEHLKIQAAFQKFTDNSVSKTINLPEEATVEEVRKIYLQASAYHCKGITVYRYGSKKGQVLSFAGGDSEEGDWLREFLTVDSEFSGGCFRGECSL